MEVWLVLFQVDALIEAFGTTKQKRALSSRRLNEVGNDTLQKAVARAADNIIDQKGVEGNYRFLIVVITIWWL